MSCEEFPEFGSKGVEQKASACPSVPWSPRGCATCSQTRRILRSQSNQAAIQGQSRCSTRHWGSVTKPNLGVGSSSPSALLPTHCLPPSVPLLSPARSILALNTRVHAVFSHLQAPEGPFPFWENQLHPRFPVRHDFPFKSSPRREADTPNCKPESLNPSTCGLLCNCEHPSKSCKEVQGAGV